jgi:hypothetical protein
VKRSPSWHFLGPRDVPLEAKRPRHIAVAIPEVRATCSIALSPRQQSSEPRLNLPVGRPAAICHITGLPTAAPLQAKTMAKK